jgi:hypothetical protein
VRSGVGAGTVAGMDNETWAREAVANMLRRVVEALAQQLRDVAGLE